MLRIKDNVDLKELEKFGFKPNKNGVYCYTDYVDGIPFYNCFITLRHHNIQIRMYETGVLAKNLQCLLYDLTQAGLVEKVEEN